MRSWLWHLSIYSTIASFLFILPLAIFCLRANNLPSNGSIFTLTKTHAMILAILLFVSMGIVALILIGINIVYRNDKRITSGLNTEEGELLGRAGIRQAILDFNPKASETELKKKYAPIRNSILKLQKEKGQSYESLEKSKIDLLSLLECNVTVEGGYQKAKTEREYYQIIQDLDKQIRKLGGSRKDQKCEDRKEGELQSALNKITGIRDKVPSAGGIDKNKAPAAAAVASGIQPSEPGERET